MLTLVEFLAPLKNGRNREKVLASMFFLRRYEHLEAVSVGRLRTALRQARVPNAAKMNIAQVLAESGSLVDSSTDGGGRRLWSLTGSGERHIRSLLSLVETELEPEAALSLASLANLTSALPDDLVRGYVEESVKCLSVGALRASVVFLWTGAIRTLHERAWSKGEAAVNAAISKQDPKARRLKKAEDFAFIRDRTFLDASTELGILDKGEKDVLVEALNLRNRCGHPTRYQPRLNKTKAFIEDIVGVVFS
jgi:hypothetical protein